MHIHKKMIIIALLGILVLAPVFGGQTTGFFGISGDYLFADDSTQEYGVGVHGNLSHRMLLGEMGLLGLSFYGRGSYDLESSALSDYSLIDVRSTWFLGSDSLDVQLGSEQTLSGSESFVTPSWQVVYRFDRGRRMINPFFGYSGKVKDSLVYHGLQAGISHAPLVELSYALALEGGVEFDPEAAQPDLLGNLTLHIDGISGYFMSWRLYGSATYRHSQDSTLEGFSGNFGGGMRIAASRKFQIQITSTIPWEYLSSLDSWALDMETSIRADIASSDHLYWYVETIAKLGQLQDLSFAAWSVEIVAGIDFSL